MTDEQSTVDLIIDCLAQDSEDHQLSRKESIKRTWNEAICYASHIMASGRKPSEYKSPLFKLSFSQKKEHSEADSAGADSVNKSPKGNVSSEMWIRGVDGISSQPPLGEGDAKGNAWYVEVFCDDGFHYKFKTKDTNQSEVNGMAGWHQWEKLEGGFFAIDSGKIVAISTTLIDKDGD